MFLVNSDLIQFFFKFLASFFSTIVSEDTWLFSNSRMLQILQFLIEVFFFIFFPSLWKIYYLFLLFLVIGISWNIRPRFKGK